MQRKLLLTVTLALLLGCVTVAQAAYYSIQLKNGQQMQVHQYWEDGGNIRFYKNGGSVAIPKESIKKIIKQEGEIKKEIMGDPSVQTVSPEEEPAQDTEPAQTPAATASEKEITEIKDKIDIIKSNLLTLNERKNFYITQRTAAVEVRQKADERMQGYQKNTYMTSEDRKQNIEIEQGKIRDAEGKISEADSKIMSLDESIENQESMKSELERKLK